jgi:hypothetical protein
MRRAELERWPMKTMPLVVLALLAAACSAPESSDEPVESSEDPITARASMRPIREALFDADERNEIWFVCKAGSGGTAATFTVTTEGSDYRVSAVYKKASFYTGYVNSTVALGKATLSGDYPHRIFAFKIGGKVARIEANLPGDGSPFLFFQGTKTKLSCGEFDAPYSVDDPFGPPP